MGLPINEMLPDHLFNAYLEDQVILKRLPKPNGKGAPPILFVVHIEFDSEVDKTSPNELTLAAMEGHYKFEVYENQMIFLHDDGQPDHMEYREMLRATVYRIGTDTATNMISPLAVFMFSETWAAELTEAEVAQYQSSLMDKGIHEVFPDKCIEMLMLGGRTFDDRSNTRTWEMIRKPNRKLRGLRNRDINPYGSINKTDTPILKEFWRGYIDTVRRSA